VILVKKKQTLYVRKTISFSNATPCVSCSNYCVLYG